jgi:hypothetical protein
MLLLEAIAHEEGFYKVGSRPQRNNNPGDLVYGNESIRFGAVSSDGRFAIFPDLLTGWNALRRWLSIPAIIKNGLLEGGYLGATIEQAIYRFAPPTENRSDLYLQYVTSMTGLDSHQILTLEMLEVPNVTGTT